VEPDEFCLPQAVQAIGSENFIIGSDYPHPPSTFPTTAAGIENMAGLSEQDKENILGGNLTRVLGLTESVCTTSGLAGTADVAQRRSP
jgi:hypothetical protein